MREICVWVGDKKWNEIICKVKGVKLIGMTNCWRNVDQMKFRWNSWKGLKIPLFVLFFTVWVKFNQSEIERNVDGEGFLVLWSFVHAWDGLPRKILLLLFMITISCSNFQIRIWYLLKCFYFMEISFWWACAQTTFYFENYLSKLCSSRISFDLHFYEIFFSSPLTESSWWQSCTKRIFNSFMLQGFNAFYCFKIFINCQEKQKSAMQSVPALPHATILLFSQHLCMKT
jgi:hypothetical protein